MPLFLSTKFSFSSPIEKGNKKSLEKYMTEGKIYAEVKHTETLISLWIYPKDCVKGSLDLVVDGAFLKVTGDFTAKTKLTPKNMKEIEQSGSNEWVVMKIDSPETGYYIDGDWDKEMAIDVELSDKK
jgi:hypothetical protein